MNYSVTHPDAPGTTLVGSHVGRFVLSLPGGTYSDIELDPDKGWVWTPINGNYRNQHEWMATFTGKAFYPLAPDPEQIDIRDIAHALSMACRYGGHVKRFYSVAEHSVLISRAVPAPYALHGLLHDATEAYLGDMIRPLKKMMPEYRAAEDLLEQVIMKKFSLGRVMPPIVKEMDLRIVQDERAVLMEPTSQPWTALDGIEPIGVNAVGLSPDEAELLFLDRFRYLCPTCRGSHRETVGMVCQMCGTDYSA